jgi:hypothetical protein
LGLGSGRFYSCGTARKKNADFASRNDEGMLLPYFLI